MTSYLYSRGNGNDGDYPRMIVDIDDTQNPYAALRALLANDYIAGRRVRRHIVARTMIDGEPEYTLYATVFEGPDGEQDMGAAWLTAEMSPVSEDAIASCYYSKPRMKLRDALDSGAWKLYRKHAEKG